MRDVVRVKEAFNGNVIAEINGVTLMLTSQQAEDLHQVLSLMYESKMDEGDNHYPEIIRLFGHNQKLWNKYYSQLLEEVRLYKESTEYTFKTRDDIVAREYANASKMALFISEFKEELRGIYKHGEGKETPYDIYMIFCNMLRENNLDI